MTEKQVSQRDMAFVSTKIRRQHSVPCATSMAESSVAELYVSTTLLVRKIKRSLKVSLRFEVYYSFLKEFG